MTSVKRYVVRNTVLDLAVALMVFGVFACYNPLPADGGCPSGDGVGQRERQSSAGDSAVAVMMFGR